MDITAVTIGVTLPQAKQDKAINLLSTNKKVKFLWRSYGDHNLTLVAFCSKGGEGKIIQEIKTILEGLNAELIHVSVGFLWEKMNYSPFDDQLDIEEKITPILENNTDSLSEEDLTAQI
jgi:hypothetical protein